MLALGAVVLLGLLAAVGLAVQADPLVPAPTSTDAAGRSIAALRAQDPRRLPAGSQAALVLREADVEQLLGRISARWWPLAWRVRLADGRATVQTSLQLTDRPWPLWLNLDATLRQTDALPEVERWRVGSLPMPPSAGAWLLRFGAERLDHGAEAALARDLIRGVEIHPGALRVVYVWRGDLAAKLRAALLPPQALARMRAYAERLAAVELPPGDEVPLETLLPPMFDLARERSAGGEDPKQENRAAILALALMAEGRSFASLSPAARDWPAPPRRVVTLGGRHDLARHFLIAALLTFEGGEKLADSMSLAKEVDDARYGSGFSFTDLAAGRAGARFARLAIESPRGLQRVVAAGVAGSDLLPVVSDLPEFMPQREFRRRYGEVGSPAYRARMAEIEARLDALPLGARVAAAPAAVR